MYQNLKVIYEDGVLKPLDKVSLKEHQRVNIFILPDDEEEAELVAAQKKALAKFVGVGKSSCDDLSEAHDKYLYSKE